MYNSTKRSAIKLLCLMSRLTFLIAVIILTFTGVIFASDVKSQNLKEVKLSVNQKNAVLKDVLVDLKNKSGFTFAYAEEIGTITGVNISFKTSPCMMR